MNPSNKARVLVSAGSKHGATAEIARLFSSGPVGDPPKPEEDPVDVADILTATQAREHHVFSGKIDKSKLGFAEKAIVMALKVPEGDFRDWEAIELWANRIAEQLTRETSTR